MPIWSSVFAYTHTHIHIHTHTHNHNLPPPPTTHLLVHTHTHARTHPKPNHHQKRRGAMLAMTDLEVDKWCDGANSDVDWKVIGPN
jgi:hypothetical protein